MALDKMSRIQQRNIEKMSGHSGESGNISCSDGIDPKIVKEIVNERFRG